MGKKNKRKKQYKKRSPMAAILPIFGHKIVTLPTRRELIAKERKKDHE